MSKDLTLSNTSITLEIGEYPAKDFTMTCKDGVYTIEFDENLLILQGYNSAESINLSEIDCNSNRGVVTTLKGIISAIEDLDSRLYNLQSIDPVLSL